MGGQLKKGRRRRAEMMDDLKKGRRTATKGREATKDLQPLKKNL